MLSATTTLWLTATVLLCVFSCKEKQRQVEATTRTQAVKKVARSEINKDSVYIARDIKVYNEVLNDLIKNHFYYYYLGSKHDKVLEGYTRISGADTSIIHARQRAITKQLIADPANLCTVYINLSNEFRSKHFDLGLGENNEFSKLIRNTIYKYVHNVPAALHYLSARQELFTDKDFYSPIAKIAAVRDSVRMRVYGLRVDDVKNRDNKNACDIGIVSMSTIVLDKEKESGILYYEFLCGSKCGRGELIEIKNMQGTWKVVHTILFWIS